MSEDELPRFEGGDRIEIDGHVYTVEQVDYLPHDDRVLQYRLDNHGDAPPATLKPDHDGGVFVVAEYHEVTTDDITHVHD